jgi:hypothetical protein
MRKCGVDHRDGEAAAAGAPVGCRLGRLRLALVATELRLQRPSCGTSTGREAGLRVRSRGPEGFRRRRSAPQRREGTLRRAVLAKEGPRLLLPPPFRLSRGAEGDRGCTEGDGATQREGGDSFSESWLRRGVKTPSQTSRGRGPPPTSLVGEDDAPRGRTSFLGFRPLVSRGRPIPSMPKGTVSFT